MAIETNCIGCGKRLSVDDEYAGRRARCPACGQIYTVPTPETSGQLPHTPESGEPRSMEVAPAASITDAIDYSEGKSAEPSQFWMLLPDGRQFGPVDRQTLNRWFHEGRVGSGYQIRCGTDGPWEPAGIYAPSDLARNRAESLTGDGPSSFQQQPLSDNPYRSTSATRTRYKRADQSGVILAMGILSFIVCPIFGVVAWVMGSSALRGIELGEIDPSNKGMTQAGYYLGMISVMLHVICIGGMLLVLAISSVAQGI